MAIPRDDNPSAAASVLPPDEASPPPDRSPEGTSLTLLERVRAGDADGWRRLVALYRPLVFHWCQRGGVSGAVQTLVRVGTEVVQLLAAVRGEGVAPGAGADGAR